LFEAVHREVPGEVRGTPGLRLLERLPGLQDLRRRQERDTASRECHAALARASYASNPARQRVVRPLSHRAYVSSIWTTLVPMIVASCQGEHRPRIIPSHSRNQDRRIDPRRHRVERIAHPPDATGSTARNQQFAFTFRC
jgi:hypothetical protein